MKLTSRINIVVAAFAMLLSMLTCGGGIIPPCDDIACTTAAGCVVCQGTPPVR